MDLTTLLRQRLAESRRPPDGKLHPSGDLLGSLRHAQLRLAGAPTIESQIVSDIRLMTGTLWHRFIGQMLVDAGVHVLQEINVNEGLPEGWSGTADGLYWVPDMRGFLLRDYKTIKGEGMKWVLKDGAKEEHIWQLSTYWHALYNMGYPLVNEFEVWYLPQNNTTERDEQIEPASMSCTPLPRDLVWGVMEDRWTACQEYLAGIVPLTQITPANWEPDGSVALQTQYVTDKLAPEIGRVQKLYWNGKQSVFDVKLVPHWSAQFCPYPTELCACSEQGSNKIGHYTIEGEYVPRKDYEHELPLVEPSVSEYRKQKAKLEKEEDGNSSKQEPVGEAA